MMEAEEMMIETELPCFPCVYQGCLATFTRVWKMEQHLGGHTGQKPYKCEREECQKTFTRKSHLQRHTRQHLGQKQFRCTAVGCTAAFVSNDRLKKHLKYRHGNQEYFTCSYEDCGKTFKKRRGLRSHYYEHTKEPAFVCQKEGCDMKFKTPNQRKIHERKHDGYPCSFKECQLVATTWTQLQKHLKTHPIEYSCTNCEKKFKHSSGLRRHKWTHAAWRSDRTCPIEDCKLNFRTAFNLEHHIRKDHFKILAFQCHFPDCQKAFAMKESLLRHHVVHDPEQKKRNINRDCRRKWRKSQRKLVIEEKLTRLFKEKPVFKLKSKIESNLSGLFNERKITRSVSIESNLSGLFNERKITRSVSIESNLSGLFNECKITRSVSIEGNLSGLFNERKITHSVSIESNLSGLFNERKITRSVSTEVNLARLFENQLFVLEKIA